MKKQTEGVLETSTTPKVAILGGITLEETKTIHKIFKNADTVLIAGNIAYTFLKAMGANIGDSFFEEDKVAIAKEIISKYGGKIVLPLDHAVSDQKKCTGDDVYFTTMQDIPRNMFGVGLGPKTTKRFTTILGKNITQEIDLTKCFYQTSQPKSSNKQTSGKLSVNTYVGNMTTF